MKPMRVGAILACLLLTAVLGCRAGGQVYEVKDAPVESAKPLTLDQVQKAIIDAGIKQTWIMTPVKPGEMLGEYNVQSHQIHVLIPYTTKNYSILYKDSSNLRYDPVKRTIHVNYAKWIERLDNEIKTRLKMAGE
ncbi:MAG TPA: hypothetical protein VLA47_06015 [Nitrospira sp.]|jgi:hypothetical protein|nr:hypothetical protein [Nitrospira sp.]